MTGQFSREDYFHWMEMIHECALQLEAPQVSEDDLNLAACNAIIAYTHLQEPDSPFRKLLFEHERTLAIANALLAPPANQLPL